ncbi:MAG: aminoglycoside phosphotransferase family protein [Bacteroidetes bacterium]|nr:aminoglycoside phosphotransferase family protein [Bacteroidota bacterium]
MLTEVLQAFDLNTTTSIVSFGHGLINNTWKVEDGEDSFIVQKINTSIFKQPEFISDNIKAIADYLAEHNPEYFFCTPVSTINGKGIFQASDGSCYRVYPFINRSHTVNVPQNSEEACEAAAMFGRLTKMLRDFPVNTLKITLPDFHNLSLRYKDFINAIQNGNADRINKSSSEISFLKQQKHIVDEYEKMIASPDFKLRVTHHDTKINNVLLDDNGKGICVIDLDTLMPGYFISDVGDMMRTYISPANEEEKDFSKILMREEYFTAIAQGYLSEMIDELSDAEINFFVFSGKFMIYMQALRFLTDYINNDIYYGRKYEDHNFIRASNQIYLLKLLLDQEKNFQKLVFNIAKKLRG